MFASVHGTETIRSQPQAFIVAFVRRIKDGLTGPRRSHYRVTREGPDTLEFRADDWVTAINVGLNEVELTASPDRRVTFDIRYPRWAAYVIALGAVFAIAFLAILLTFDIRGYIATHSASRFPGLSIDQNVAVAWAFAFFWGFVWPWILILLHRRPLRRLTQRLIVEVDAAAV
ncbi:MAG TPA: hypothetical protein VII12_14810 [Thermoanaerobaculia bacterium]|jgi:hypothetical protein